MNVRASISTAVVSLCLLTGGVLLAAPVALAAGPPVVEETSVVNVAGTSATFKATIDPEESETTYRFEYGTTEAYGSSIPVPDGLVGSGAAPVTVTTHPQDLSPSTEYHYRAVALVASRGETVPGADGTFTTQPAGGEFALPDGRQWELVTPPNKHGASIQNLTMASPLQAATDGGGFTYGVTVPTEAEPPGYVSGNSSFEQVLSLRGPQGWFSRDIGSPHNSRAGLGNTEYKIFSPELSTSVIYPQEDEDRTLLSEEASELTPYIRRESLCDSPATAGECYLPVVTGKEGFADVPPGTEFGEWTAAEISEGQQPRLIFEGATPDLSHVVLRASTALTATPLPPPPPKSQGPSEGIYAWTAGVPAAEALQLVSFLPANEGGGPAQRAIAIGFASTYPPSGGRHAISDDGTRIFWLAKELERENNGKRLYMRNMTRKETVRIDAQQPGVPSGGTPEASFRIANSEGSKVFFTDIDQQQRLTPQSGAQEQDLYECEIVEEAGKLSCRLTDLTPESGGRSAEMQGTVLGASEDGSYLYFVADGVLGDGAERGATQGACRRGAPGTATCNLYEDHDGTITFITALSQRDGNDWGFSEPLTLHSQTARVSPNGRYLAFMSDRSLTGYDNRDAVSGQPDMEVYLYDAQTGRLMCASCNPTGSRPVGVSANGINSLGQIPIVGLYGNNYSEEFQIAANLPGANEVGFEGSSLYQPRALSDSGRLFFDSSDALVAQDVNGEEDVYEFEPVGTGGCSSSSVTFNPRSGGCVGLISSGTSPEESAFLDASVGGGDVFFLTSSRLTSQDYDTAYDVYDAHECTVSSPCVEQPVSSPPCDSGDSCKAAPTPQPSIFGAPASATFNGSGNVVASSTPAVVKPKSLTRAQRLARALNACHKKLGRKRRGCERQARKRYSARAARGAGKTIGTTRKAQG
ncbi:MAG TPA: hypothetical protein VNV42_10730 [Solirubrobacteraceae bacterium]|jgi:hypothetical protein|nr:hypothetical protein [Solirubrobacteraceae bacterium]